MKAQNAELPAAEIAELIGERWRRLGPVKQARCVAAAAPPASKRGKAEVAKGMAKAAEWKARTES
jgi:hypothetical protein